jgi:hypothetical protein
MHAADAHVIRASAAYADSRPLMLLGQDGGAIFSTGGGTLDIYNSHFNANRAAVSDAPHGQSYVCSSFVCSLLLPALHVTTFTDIYTGSVLCVDALCIC